MQYIHGNAQFNRATCNAITIIIGSHCTSYSDKDGSVYVVLQANVITYYVYAWALMYGCLTRFGIGAQSIHIGEGRVKCNARNNPLEADGLFVCSN